MPIPKLQIACGITVTLLFILTLSDLKVLIRQAKDVLPPCLRVISRLVGLTTPLWSHNRVKGLINSCSLFTCWVRRLFIFLSFKVHAEEINFQFEPCEMSPGPCSFLNTSLQIIPKRHKLMVGQPYRIELTLELPESVANQVQGLLLSLMLLLAWYCSAWCLSLIT